MKALEAQKKKKGFLSGALNAITTKVDKQEQGSISFGCANLFACQFCTYPKPDHGMNARMDKQDEKLQIIVDYINGTL